MKNCQNVELFRPAGANPLSDVDVIRKVYAGNRSTKAINIWCDSVSKLGIYRQKTAMGHPPHKRNRSPLAPQLLARFKKIKGCKNGTDIIYLHPKFGGDPPLHDGVRKKLGVFVFLCLFVLFCFFFVCHALDLGQRFSHSNSDIFAICRSILIRISAFFSGKNALLNG